MKSSGGFSMLATTTVTALIAIAHGNEEIEIVVVADVLQHHGACAMLKPAATK